MDVDGARPGPDSNDAAPAVLGKRSVDACSNDLKSSQRKTRIVPHRHCCDPRRVRQHLIGRSSLNAETTPTTSHAESETARSGPGRPGRESIAIGRSYLSPLSSAEGMRVRPPFKPCMRISRTRLTKWASGRGMRHPRILNRAEQADQPKALEEGAVPSQDPACCQTRPRALDEQPAESSY